MRVGAKRYRVPMNDSHVFVTLGDITHLECDAWMLPTDSSYSIRHIWREAVPALTDDLIARSKTDEFSAGVAKATSVVGWPANSPLPVLTAVPMRGLRTATDLEDLGASLAQFVEVAAKSTGGDARHERLKRLFAIPAFGTEGGGGGLKKGEILSTLLREANVAANDHDVDVVLVLRDERTFALAQQLRKGSPGRWSMLTPSQRKTAERLADQARNGKLVPFMGAGVSASAGGPTWSGLIRKLALGIGMDDAQIKSLTSAERSALDQAAYLRELYRRKNGDATAFGTAVAAAVTTDRYGLAPALLASLRTEQAITLNYDALFERASEDVKDVRTIIPSDDPSSSRSGKWLLKLHGSVDAPETIVLTRDDYLGYSANREALSAIVKANLITHHLLFVGFGLADDHFHQIIHDVRRAVPISEGNKLGTALTMQADELDEALWNEQLDLVSMDSSDGVWGASRQLEIFLDALLAHATDSHSYLLNDSFESSLTDSQRALRTKLLHFWSTLDDQDHADVSWPIIDQMFRDLGGSGR